MLARRDLQLSTPGPQDLLVASAGQQGPPVTPGPQDLIASAGHQGPPAYYSQPPPVGNLLDSAGQGPKLTPGPQDQLASAGQGPPPDYSRAPRPPSSCWPGTSGLLPE